MIVPIHLAEIKNGELFFFDRKRFDKWILTLGNKKVEVIVRKRTKQRSAKQNNYLWGVAYKVISEETGMEPDEVHEFFKLKFLKYNVGKFETLKSTTKLTTGEFMGYVEKIVQFSSQELNCVIPLPLEADF